MSRGAQLRALLEAPTLAFLMEAHDGLSARIAETEGFEALWASGFSISTALGLRDSEEASWSQVIDVVECMAEATTIPIVVDADTGYGSFNTARRFVKKAERAGAAGACLEDKVTPKINSFFGDRHPLASVAEFSGKLRACKDGQDDPDFCLIARTEALIAGYSVEEAVERALAYQEAGADAVFIHSRKDSDEDIASFAEVWQGRLPIVISPTTYARTPTDVFRCYGVSAVIWANHSMRAATAAIRRACRELHAVENVEQTKVELASVADVFNLMRYRDLVDDELRYNGASGEAR